MTSRGKQDADLTKHYCQAVVTGPATDVVANGQRRCSCVPSFTLVAWP